MILAIQPAFQSLLAEFIHWKDKAKPIGTLKFRAMFLQFAANFPIQSRTTLLHFSPVISFIHECLLEKLWFNLS